MDDYIPSKSINHYNANNFIFETDPVAFGLSVDFGSKGLQVCCEFGHCYDLNKFCLGGSTLNEMIPFDDPARRSFPSMGSLDTHRPFPENPMLMVNPRTLKPIQCWCPQISKVW